MVAINNNGDEFDENPKTLGYWVKNFRLKKIQMKRKLRSGGNLRVCAILSTALIAAELELHHKQQERFQKWLEFQTKINNHELHTKSELHHHSQRHQQSEEELVSRHQTEETDRKQREAIDNLWKCELSDLDNFMRNISSSSKKVQSHNEDVELDTSYQRHIQTNTVRVSS